MKKEQAKQIIDQLPEYKITKILYLLKDIQNDDEIEYELFCENLAEKYLNSSNHEMISFEDAIKEAGLTIDDLQISTDKKTLNSNRVEINGTVSKSYPKKNWVQKWVQLSAKLLFPQ